MHYLSRYLLCHSVARSKEQSVKVTILGVLLTFLQDHPKKKRMSVSDRNEFFQTEVYFQTGFFCLAESCGFFFYLVNCFYLNLLLPPRRAALPHPTHAWPMEEARSGSSPVIFNFQAVQIVEGHTTSTYLMSCFSSPTH